MHYIVLQMNQSIKGRQVGVLLITVERRRNRVRESREEKKRKRTLTESCVLKTNLVFFSWYPQIYINIFSSFVLHLEKKNSKLVLLKETERNRQKERAEKMIGIRKECNEREKKKDNEQKEDQKNVLSFSSLSLLSFSVSHSGNR